MTSDTCPLPLVIFSRECQWPSHHSSTASPRSTRWRRPGGAGTDKVTLLDFEKNLQANLRALADDLRSGQYQPQPYRLWQVPKGGGELRTITILAIRDRVAQRATMDVIEPLFEKRFLDCSFGFREGRSTRDAVQAIMQHRDAGYRWVVDADIPSASRRSTTSC